MISPEIRVAVENTPVDWLSAITAIFAAFFGAAAAFYFNFLQEASRSREKQLAETNIAAYGLIMSLELLLNFKKQHLTKFEDKFSKALQALRKISPADSGSSLDNIILLVSSHFADISKEDATLNALFKNWQVLDFRMTPSPMALSFTVDGSTEIMRLVLVANVEVNQITERISQRNKKAENYPFMSLDTANHEQKMRIVLFWLEMLDIRSLIREHVDTALIVIKEALDELIKYRDAYLPPRNRAHRFFYSRKLEPRITYKLPDQWKPLMPDRKLYEHIISLS